MRVRVDDDDPELKPTSQPLHHAAGARGLFRLCPLLSAPVSFGARVWLDPAVALREKGWQTGFGIDATTPNDEYRFWGEKPARREAQRGRRQSIFAPDC